MALLERVATQRGTTVYKYAFNNQELTYNALWS